MLTAPASAWCSADRLAGRHRPELCASLITCLMAASSSRPIGWRAPWLLPAGASTPVLLGDYGNDNSPCVLPDGQIVSLWLGRPGSSGLHEIKLMNADGSAYVMVLADQDVVDAGLGCGR
jgi:hypothetical protein